MKSVLAQDIRKWIILVGLVLVPLFVQSEVLSAGVIHPQAPFTLDTSLTRFPTIARIDSDILLYVQRRDDTLITLQGYRISTTGGVAIQDTFTVLPVERKPFRPSLYANGGKQVLVWYEDVTAYDSTVKADTTFQVKAVIFDAEYPSVTELMNEQFVVYAPRSYGLRPSFATVGNYIYFDVLRWLYPDMYDDGHKIVVRRMDKHTGILDTTVLRFDSDGDVALVSRSDTLLIINSTWVCTQSSGPNFDVCTRVSAGYYVKRYVGLEAVYSGLLNLGSGFGIAWEWIAGNTRVWSDANGSMIITTVPKRIFSLAPNATEPVKQVELPPTTYSFQPISEEYPVAVGEYMCLLSVAPDKLSANLMLFNRSWQFVDSARFNFEGYPIDFSEILPADEENTLVFAYSSRFPDVSSPSRTYVQLIKLDVTTDVTIDEDAPLPSKFSLNQNYPNPFNPSTSIQFTLPRSTHVALEVFNTVGQRVKTLVSGELSSGTYTAEWNGQNSAGQSVASGIYFYRLVTKDYVESKKMMLLK